MVLAKGFTAASEVTLKVTHFLKSHLGTTNSIYVMFRNTKRGNLKSFQLKFMNTVEIKERALFWSPEIIKKNILDE